MSCHVTPGPLGEGAGWSGGQEVEGPRWQGRLLCDSPERSVSSTELKGLLQSSGSGDCV